jgi:hypothetical protein
VYALQTADIALRKTGVLPDPIRPASTLADMPVLRSFMIRYPSGQAQSIQDFYDAYDKTTKVIDTIRYLITHGEPLAGLRELGIDVKGVTEQQAEDALRAANIDPTEWVRLERIHKALGKAQQVIQLVDKNPEMPADEKRQLIDTMYYQMIEMAGAGNEALRTMKKAVDQASKAHKELVE